MLIRRTVFVTLMLAASFVPSAAAQEDACLRRTITLTVTDAKGLPVQGLKADDFEARVHGKPVRILSLTPDNRPHRIVILLDASGSMRSNNAQSKWAVARAIAAHAASGRLPNTEVALILFSSRYKEAIGFGQGTKGVAARLEEIGLQPGFAHKHVAGTTPLLDTILAASDMFGSARTANIIYAITDGGENSSHAQRKKLERTLMGSGIRVFTFLFGTYYSPSSGIRASSESDTLDDFTEFAEETGGGALGKMSVLSPVQTADFRLTDEQKRALSDNLDQMYLNMLVAYRAEVELPQPIKKWTKMSVSLSSGARARIKGAQIAFPHKQPPCADSPVH